MDEPIFYTPKEVAGILKIAAKTVVQMIRQRRLGATIVGKHYRISANDLEEFRQRNTIRVKVITNGKETSQ